MKNYLSNPEIFNINRIKAHSDHKYFSPNKNFIISLNGTWDFSYCGGEWSSIQVPGHIELQGFGSPQYVNTMYPWDGREDLKPGQVPKDINSFGTYKKEIALPDDWKNSPVYISFQGVESSLALYCNDSFVGYSEDSFTPSEFDLTPFLKEKDNSITAVVHRWCSGSWLEDQDFWRFSGIFRDVYLYTIPEVHIKDLFFTSEIEDNFKDGKIIGNIELQYTEQIPVDIYIEVLDRDKKIACKTIPVDTPVDRIDFEFTLMNIELWSAEKPSLYEVNTFILGKGTDDIIEMVPQKFGFRRFEIEDGIMKLNGKRIIFKGVNRHEFNCRTGRTLSEEDMLWDIKFLKDNNFNAVRTSHYPNTSRWYELCDEYGLYVIDEVNLETHGTWQFMGRPSGDRAIPDDKPEWLENILDRAQSMLERDKNHPSILIWSCGNESYGGENIFRMSKYLRQRDSSRLVHYEGTFWDRRFDDTSDMESRMYAKVSEIEKYLKDSPKKPFLLCEYTHAMGNSNGALHRYSELEEKYPMYQGGFIWDYIDQSLSKDDPHGEEYLAFGGDYDDRPTDYNFCVNGLIYGDRKPSPKMQEVKQLFSDFKIIPDKDKVLVKNRSLFTDIDEYTLSWKLLRDGNTIVDGILDLSLPPEHTIEVVHDIPDQVESGEYAIRFSLSSPDREITFGEYIYSIEQNEKKTPSKKVEIIDGDCNIGVHGEGFEVLFSKAYGALISLKYSGKEMLVEKVLPNFWRAPTDNDRGNMMAQRYAQWKIASLYCKASQISLERFEDKALITYRYDLFTSPETYCHIIYTVWGNGTVEVEMDYPGFTGISDMPLFGMNLRLKKEFENVKYYGLGPLENYIDRRHGAYLGIFETSAQENLSQYVIPQECGNRTQVRWCDIKDENGMGIRVTSDIPFEFSLLFYTAHELENAGHHYALPKPYSSSLNINMRQMGVGGDDSWGAKTHPEYLVESDKHMNFKFKIAPIY